MANKTYRLTPGKLYYLWESSVEDDSVKFICELWNIRSGRSQGNLSLDCPVLILSFEERFDHITYTLMYSLEDGIAQIAEIDVFHEDMNTGNLILQAEPCY